MTNLSDVPKLVATDLDGTLLHTDGTVTERTREVLDALDARGITVVFVTGRPIRWMEPLWHHVGDHGLAICSNGGIVYDVPGRSVLEARTIPGRSGSRSPTCIRTAIPGSVFALEKTTGFGKEPEFLPRPEDKENPDLRVGPMEEIFDDTVVKLLALHLEMAPDDYWAQVEHLVGHAVTTTWSSVGSLIEMSAAGVTKASTLELICAERGIAARGRGRLRGHAQRHTDARVGRNVVRDGQRAREHHRGRGPHRAAQRRGRRRPGAHRALPLVTGPRPPRPAPLRRRATDLLRPVPAAGARGSGGRQPVGEPTRRSVRHTGMRRLALLTALLLLPLMWVGAEPAFACSCVVRTVPDQVAAADAVAQGRLVGRDDSNPQEVVYTFAGTDLYKGDVSLDFEVHTAAQSAACGLAGLVVGRRYVMFMDRDGGRLTANICGGSNTATAAYVAKVEAATGPGTELGLPPLRFAFPNPFTRWLTALFAAAPQEMTARASGSDGSRLRK